VCMLVFAVMRQSETGIVTNELGNDETRLLLRTKHDVHQMYRQTLLQRVIVPPADTTA